VPARNSVPLVGVAAAFRSRAQYSIDIVRCYTIKPLRLFLLPEARFDYSDSDFVNKILPAAAAEKERPFRLESFCGLRSKR
jgi:hypothetical protein